MLPQSVVWVRLLCPPFPESIFQRPVEKLSFCALLSFRTVGEKSFVRNVADSKDFSLRYAPFKITERRISDMLHVLLPGTNTKKLNTILCVWPDRGHELDKN